MDRRAFLKLTAAAATVGLIGSYPLLIERSLVRVNRYRIAVPRLPAPFDGFTIVHLSDIHHGPGRSLRFLREVVATANRIPHDLTVCTGDYVVKREQAAAIDEVWPLLAQLKAPCGVHAVLGNHDHWFDPERSLAWMRRAGQELHHRVVPLQRGGARLWLAGAGDFCQDHRPLDPLLAGIPSDECRLVLAHSPDTADTPFEGRIDLMLSGHTHGGQIDIPGLGAPLVPVRNKRYVAGALQADKGFPLFISRGIGWVALPARFHCAPEIAVVQLSPAGRLT